MTILLAYNLLLLATTLLFGGCPANASLNGRALYCCTLINNPIMSHAPLKKPYQLSGIGINYLINLMLDANFTCSVVEPVKVSGNGGFNNVVEAMEECRLNPNRSDSFFDNLGLSRNMCKCDLGTGGWSFTTQRLGRVDYLPYFSKGDFRVITNLKNTTPAFSGTFFLTTFTKSVWIAITGLLVIWTFLKTLDRRFIPPSDNFIPLSADHSQFSRTRHLLLKSNILRRLRLSFMATSDEVVYTRESSTRHWVLNTSIMLCGIFLYLSYEAVMTTNLVQEGRTSKYQSIEDFRSCKIRPKDVCIMDGTSQKTFWDKFITNEKCNESLQALTNEKDLNEMVYNGACKYGIVYSPMALAVTTGKYCRKLTFVGEPFYIGGVSYILPKNRSYLSELTNATLRLRENGELQNPEDYFGDSGCDDDGEATSLSFKRLELFFIFAYGACAVFFAYMLVDPQKPMTRSSTRNSSNHKNCEDKPKDEKAMPKMSKNALDEQSK